MSMRARQHLFICPVSVKTDALAPPKRARDAVDEDADTAAGERGREDDDEDERRGGLGRRNIAKRGAIRMVTMVMVGRRRARDEVGG